MFTGHIIELCHLLTDNLIVSHFQSCFQFAAYVVVFSLPPICKKACLHDRLRSDYFFLIQDFYAPLQLLIQFLRFDRFQKVICYPQFQGTPNISKIIIAADNQNRDLKTLRTQFLHQFNSSDSWHPYVCNYDVRKHFSNQFQACFTVCSFTDHFQPKPIPLSQFHDNATRPGLIVNDHYFSYHSYSPFSYRACIRTLTVVPVSGLLSIDTP